MPLPTGKFKTIFPFFAQLCFISVWKLLNKGICLRPFSSTVHIIAVCHAEWFHNTDVGFYIEGIMNLVLEHRTHLLSQ